MERHVALQELWRHSIENKYRYVKHVTRGYTGGECDGLSLKDLAYDLRKVRFLSDGPEVAPVARKQRPGPDPGNVLQGMRP